MGGLRPNGPCINLKVFLQQKVLNFSKKMGGSIQNWAFFKKKQHGIHFLSETLWGAY